MKPLNRMRLAAGLPIDGRIEVTEAKAPETVEPIMEAAGPLNDFCIVGSATPRSSLIDVLHHTNARGLINIIKGSSADELAQMLIFAGADEAAATKKAKQRLKDAKAADAEKAPVKENTEDDERIVEDAIVESEMCQQCQAAKLEDEDYAAAVKLSSQARSMQGSEEQTARLAAARMHLNKFESRGEDLRCPSCKEESEKKRAALLAVAESENLEEFVVGSRAADMQSWEKDEKGAVNTASANGNDDETMVAAARPEDKDESPDQLRAPGDLGDAATDKQGYDADKKVMVPSKIKQLLRDEMQEAEMESKRQNYSQRDAAEFYRDLAGMFEDLLRHLEGGTVYDIKQAQIFMTSLMGPMLHKIPAEVVNFLARGGEPASLRSYMNKVDVKV